MTEGFRTLDQLDVGQRGRIVDVLGDDGISVRLMEMGLIEGENIEVLGFAPFRDPIEFYVRGYRVSLRADEARRVQVEIGREGDKEPGRQGDRGM
jgi:ferrous iron transport protein A